MSKLIVPDWSDNIVVVVASGPTARDVGVEKIRDANVRMIVVNTSYKLVPYANLLYATDFQWWYHNHRGVQQNFRGQRVAPTKKKIETTFNNISTVDVVPPHDPRRSTIILEPEGLIGSGGNSGFQALNIAAQTGTSRIVMVGFDMTTGLGYHWHGDHKARNPEETDTARWAMILDEQAAVFKSAGIEVFNCSPISALQNYPKVRLSTGLYG